MPAITRKINWISSVTDNKAIQDLELALTDFYSTNKNYYSDIDFTADNWINEQEHGYRQIAKLASSAASVCEIGCGNANILKHHAELASVYTGLDFSEDLMKSNAIKYPDARFISLRSANEFPVDDQQFDLVFSVFVLEHVTGPAIFLNECRRILKPGGVLVIFCPDFLGRGRMSSQRAGFSEGTASKKLKQKKIIDAFVTLFDNRIRIPWICSYYRRQAAKKPLFLINVSPVVFEDEFQPDVDAVYLTWKKEICEYLSGDLATINNDLVIEQYEKVKKLIFLQMVKSKTDP